MFPLRAGRQGWRWFFLPWNPLGPAQSGAPRSLCRKTYSDRPRLSRVQARKRVICSSSEATSAIKAPMNFRMHRRLSRPCVAQTVLAISAFAQAQPVFHAGTRLVQVDVVARNKSGPVAGLKKEDFTLFDEGSPQQISVFSVITKQSNKSATPLSAGTVSNRLNRLGEAPPSATVLLI